MVETTVETRMEALRRRLIQAVKVDGIATYKDLSKALNQNPTFVQQFVTKRSPKRLYDEQVETITRILDAKEAHPQANSPKDAETQLRSALLAFGVDRTALSRAIGAIRAGFVKGEEPPEQTLPDDQSEPANPRREVAPSR